MARGYDQKDINLFSGKEAEKLQRCMQDAVYLVDRGYSPSSAIEFTANHYRCPSRQKLMLNRAICSEKSLLLKESRELNIENIKGSTLHIDGFNLIITLEVMYSGGTLYKGRDGCIRDIAGLRGSYHLIDETNEAIKLIAQAINNLQSSKAVFYLDSPISNLGRLKVRILEYQNLFNCPIEIEVIHNPDQLLYDKSVVVTSDGIILERCGAWFNVASYCLQLTNKNVSVDFSNI